MSAHAFLGLILLVLIVTSPLLVIVCTPRPVNRLRQTKRRALRYRR